MAEGSECLTKTLNLHSPIEILNLKRANRSREKKHSLVGVRQLTSLTDLQDCVKRIAWKQETRFTDFAFACNWPEKRLKSKCLNLLIAYASRIFGQYAYGQDEHRDNTGRFHFFDWAENYTNLWLKDAQKLKTKIKVANVLVILCKFYGENFVFCV
jgi:hypothetical protein